MIRSIHNLRYKTVKKEWDERSLHLQDNFESVMFASFPKKINEMLHNWQLSLIARQLSDAENMQILDIGCGYGRLSFPLSQMFPKSFFYGIDISKKYVQMFNKKLKNKGKAYEGNLRKLPFKENTFDTIFIVTVLMYLHDPEIKLLLEECKKVLKPAGKIIIIENNSIGLLYITGFGILTFFKNIVNKNRHKIKSRVFRDKELTELLRENFVIIKKENCSLLTILLPFLLLFYKFELFKKKDISIKANFPIFPSVYTYYFCEKKLH